MAGTWHSMDATHAPAFSASSALLLTDGRVLCQQVNSTNWFLLSPDSHGSYRNGHWTATGSASKPRLYYASAVLNDGRVLVAGGEYAPNSGDDTNVCEIFDPGSHSWSTISHPAGWTRIGDAACAPLADGRVLIGNLDDGRTAVFDPATDTWTAGGNKGISSSEETWTLLPDGTVLTVVCNPPQNADGSWSTRSQRYLPSSDTWIDAGHTGADLIDHALSTEIGPAMRLPDGRVMYFGGTGHTAFYTPGPSGTPGTWAAGPDLPNGSDGQPMAVRDAPAAALPNGTVLCCAGLGSAAWGAPTTFFEYDPAANSFTDVGNPSGSSQNPYEWRLLLLPNGEVLATVGTAAAYVYSPTPPTAARDEAAEPTVTSVAHHLVAGISYVAAGKRFNGQSQGTNYGDDCSNATNYPLVRLSYPHGRVVYCKTHGHSTMGLATGHDTVSTTFDVPSGAPTGSAQLSVVANGIPSDPIHVDVQQWRLGNLPWEAVWEFLIGSLADGDLWTIDQNGHIHHIPPRGPEEVVKEAELALRSIVDGVESLKRLGATLQSRALHQAKAEAGTRFLRE